ncbi:hypothetical protein CPB84DRAFT_1767176 [Gymnopilus junonius]|uniref:Secreted protein n=1 Tax=Gymnopilus junonius TaxID=109634 RepID=A0A9P5NU43_GYMJU|nr:hypothetical protein CPB84DRAFT_1767176 [Gymnopilus junonius]
MNMDHLCLLHIIVPLQVLPQAQQQPTHTATSLPITVPTMPRKPSFQAQRTQPCHKTLSAQAVQFGLRKLEG